MLLRLLACPVPFHAALTTETQMAVLRQERDSSDNMASYGHLGIYSGAAVQWSLLCPRNYKRHTILLDLVERVEQRAGFIRYSVRQYPRFYCEVIFFLCVADGLSK